MIKALKQYKYTIGFILSVCLAFILFLTGVFDLLADSLNGAGYPSAIVAGFLFPITFTAAAGGLYLMELGTRLNPIITALLGGFGAMIADLLMFRFINGTILQELKLIAAMLIPKHRRQRMERFTKKRVFLIGVPFLASLLIASPLPDEIGIALFGLVNFKPKYLSLITYLLNTAGIFVLVFAGYAFGTSSP
ncbi:MAG: hypothetical protein HYY51_02840 [Candidatus Magasanikbacteria bacterium]|nr:hypothetical protein [Candidatus Magasanikbacteria bacterium]